MLIVNPDKTKKRYTLNALRGLSAILIAFYHIIGFGIFLDPGFLPAGIENLRDGGVFRVLIFFVISGAVISLSNKKNLTLKTIPAYIKKRALRIYPIYAACLVITLIVSESRYSINTIAGNFAFLHVLFVDVIDNVAIWSLHYEIIFYILFIPISLLNINPVIVATTSVLVGLVNFFLHPYLHSPVIITTYCFGFTFWALGLIIVKYFKKNVERVNYTRLVSFLFLIITIPFLNQIRTAFYEYPARYLGSPIEFPYIDMQMWYKTAISFADLALLPYCFMAVILFSERTFKFKNVVLLILQLVPAYTLYVLFKEGNLEVNKLIFPLCCYLISWILFLIDIPFVKRMSVKLINFLMWMGGISYGIYVIHVPVLLFFNQISSFSGSATTFYVRLLLYFLTTFSIAYFLEYKYQKWILNFLQHKRLIILKETIRSSLKRAQHKPGI